MPLEFFLGYNFHQVHVKCELDLRSPLGEGSPSISYVEVLSLNPRHLVFFIIDSRIIE